MNHWRHLRSSLLTVAIGAIVGGAFTVFVVAVVRGVLDCLFPTW